MLAQSASMREDALVDLEFQKPLMRSLTKGSYRNEAIRL